MELSKFARIKFLQRFLPNDRERNDLRFRKNGTRFMRVEERDVLPLSSSFQSFEIRTYIVRCISLCDTGG